MVTVDTDAAILHVDMDAFFASVEVRDDPSLRDDLVVVGGAGPRGVVAAASYRARTRGIHSAMPMATARRLAPDLVIVPPRIDRYREVSRQVMQILESVTPQVDQVSIDEAYLDVNGARRLFGPPRTIAERIRSTVRAELDLPCSVGGGVSRTVAKIASGRAKPDGLLIVEECATVDFLDPLPVSVVPGIGPKAVASLQQLGVHTLAQVRHTPLSALQRAVGASARPLQVLALGEDRTGLGSRRARDRSVGTERTFDQDIVDPQEIRRRLTLMADDVARSLRRGGFVSATVSIKLRSPDGRTITRSVTASQPTASGERLREHAIALWERVRDQMPSLRLAGVRAENLIPVSGSGSQDELTGRGTGWRGLEEAMDRAVDRFGAGTLLRGSTLHPSAPEDDPSAREGSCDPRTREDRPRTGDDEQQPTPSQGPDPRAGRTAEETLW